MSDQPTPADAALDAALVQLRSATATQHAPPRVEKALMAAFAARQRRTRVKRFFSQFLAPGVAVSATAAVAAWMMFAPLTQPVVQSLHSDIRGDSIAYLAAADTPFVALASREEILAESPPRLVQADLPRSWLASAGLPIDPQGADESVRAEMLVGASGQTLAMRLMP